MRLEDLEKPNDHVPGGAAGVWRAEITNSYTLSPLLIVIFKDRKFRNFGKSMHSSGHSTAAVLQMM